MSKDTIGHIINWLASPKEREIWEDDIETYLELVTQFHYIQTYEIKKFAGKLKEAVSMFTGIPVEDLEKPEVKNGNLGEMWNRPETGNAMTVRVMLQLFGTEACRKQIHTNFWVNALFADYDNSPNWIVTDVRFPNELKAIEDRNGIVIRVFREVCPKCGENENLHTNWDYTSKSIRTYDSIHCNECGTYFNDSTHLSETSLDSHPFQYVIDNSGTIKELIEKVKTLYEQLNGCTS